MREHCRQAGKVAPLILWSRVCRRLPPYFLFFAIFPSNDAPSLKIYLRHRARCCFSSFFYLLFSMACLLRAIQVILRYIYCSMFQQSLPLPPVRSAARLMPIVTSDAAAAVPPNVRPCFWSCHASFRRLPPMVESRVKDDEVFGERHPSPLMAEWLLTYYWSPYATLSIICLFGAGFLCDIFRYVGLLIDFRWWYIYHDDLYIFIEWVWYARHWPPLFPAPGAGAVSFVCWCLIDIEGLSDITPSISSSPSTPYLLTPPACLPPLPNYAFRKAHCRAFAEVFSF